MFTTSMERTWSDDNHNDRNKKTKECLSKSLLFKFCVGILSDTRIIVVEIVRKLKEL